MIAKKKFSNTFHRFVVPFTRYRKSVRLSFISGLLVTILLCYPSMAKAQLDFTFSEPIQSRVAGDTFNFLANLSNSSDEQIVFSAFNPGLTAPGVTINDLFFTNVPETLNPGDSFTYALFGVTFDPSAAPGTYLGLADIEYDTSTSTGQHASQGYSIDITSVTVPETSSFAASCLGILTLAYFRKRHLQKAVFQPVRAYRK